MNEIYQEAVSLFTKGWYCGESVLLALAEELDINSPLIPAAATGFCSGIARSNDMCGALSGGILALNIKYGRRSVKESVEENYTAVQGLLKKFEQEFDSINCRQLLGCDLSSPEGAEQFAKKELWKKCQHYTGRVAEITQEIIEARKKQK